MPRECHSQDASAQGSRVTRIVIVKQSLTQTQPVQEDQSKIRSDQQRLAKLSMEASNQQIRTMENSWSFNLQEAKSEHYTLFADKFNQFS